MTPDVTVRPTYDPNVREYHVTEDDLSEVPFASFYQPLWDTDDGFSQLGDTGAEIVSTLMKGERNIGIEEILIRPHSLEVRKSYSSDWSKLEPTVIKALEKGLNRSMKVQAASITANTTFAHAGR